MRLEIIQGVILLGMLSLMLGQANAEIEYVSIAENAAVMYEEPSLQSKKLYVASIHLPVEAVITVAGWVKVRDRSGVLAWVENKFLSERRFVIVTVPLAKVYEIADENSVQVFQAQEDIVMERLDSDVPGWIKVRHRDGQLGYIKVSEVWGA